MSMVEPLKMATPMTNLGLVQQCCCLLAAILTEERAIVDEKTIEASSLCRTALGGALMQAARVNSTNSSRSSPACRSSTAPTRWAPASSPTRSRRSTTSPSTSRRSDGRSGRARSPRTSRPPTASSRRSCCRRRTRCADVAARHGGDGEGGDHLHRRVGHGEDDDHQSVGVARPGGVHVARAELFEPHVVEGRADRSGGRAGEAHEGHLRPARRQEAPLLRRRLEHAEGRHVRHPAADRPPQADRQGIPLRPREGSDVQVHQNLQFIGAMVPGRNPVDPRFMRLSNTFAIAFPPEESIKRIYSTILRTFFSTGAFATELQGDDFSHKVTGVAMEIFNSIVTGCRRRPPSSTTSSTCATSPASSRACSASPRTSRTRRSPSCACCATNSSASLAIASSTTPTATL